MSGRFIGIKNIKGRQEFMRMLNDMEDGKDGVDFVLVFKLSRFGRNAADVIVYGVINAMKWRNGGICQIFRCHRMSAIPIGTRPILLNDTIQRGRFINRLVIGM